MTEAWQQHEPWHVTVHHDYAPAPAERAWRPRQDLTTAVLMIVVLALVAPIVGLFWAHVAPKLSLTQLIAGSEIPFRSQIGADAWFLLLTAIAGAVTGWFAYAVGGRGPGVLLGLALGGAAASAVAARVGYLAEHHRTLDALRAHGITARPDLLNILDFKVRALGVATAWPLAAILVFVIIVAIRDGR